MKKSEKFLPLKQYIIVLPNAKVFSNSSFIPLPFQLWHRLFKLKNDFTAAHMWHLVKIAVNCINHDDVIEL